MKTQAEITELHGSFFGSALTAEDCEALTLGRIGQKILKTEASLYETKWFDYRELHPAMATYLFAHHFNRAYGEFMNVSKNRKLRFMAAFTGKDVLNVREKVSFWRARQKADELGIRYEFFLREAMNWFISNGWVHAPRPAHFFNPDLLIHISNKWDLECRAKLQWARSPRYRTANFINSKDQVAYEGHIVTQIMQRAHPKFSLCVALYMFDALRIETAIEKIPEHVILEAIENSSQVA